MVLWRECTCYILNIMGKLHTSIEIVELDINDIHFVDQIKCYIEIMVDDTIPLFE